MRERYSRKIERMRWRYSKDIEKEKEIGREKERMRERERE